MECLSHATILRKLACVRTWLARSDDFARPTQANVAKCVELVQRRWPFKARHVRGVAQLAIRVRRERGPGVGAAVHEEHDDGAERVLRRCFRLGRRRRWLPGTGWTSHPPTRDPRFLRAVGPCVGILRGLPGTPSRLVAAILGGSCSNVGGDLKTF